MPVGPGTRIKNRYEIQRSIGEGGFAWVYEAKDLELGRPVAVKVLKMSRQNYEKDLERFQREARLLAQVQHPHIVAVFAFDILDDLNPCIVMEYLEGQSLSSYLAIHGPLDAELAKQIFLQVSEGLGYAHKLGLVHRDLTTANIFLTGVPPLYTVKLIDFGLSKLLADTEDKLTRTGVLVGTPAYMSPELARGQPFDKRSDIYSFGCVMYESLTGKPPFSNDSPIGLLHMQQYEYPKEPSFQLLKKNEEIQLKNIILRCLQKEPNLRFQSCEEISEAFTNENQSLINSGSGAKGTRLHQWTGSAGQSNNGFHWKTGLAAALIVVPSFFLVVFAQDFFFECFAQCFVFSKSSLLVSAEQNFAIQLKHKRKASLAEPLFVDLRERALKQKDTVKYIAMSFELAECYFVRKKTARGFEILDQMLSLATSNSNSDLKLDKSALRSFCSQTSSLLDIYASSGKVTLEELMLRARLLLLLSTSNKTSNLDILRSAIVKLISREHQYDHGLSADESASWHSTKTNAVQRTLTKAVTVTFSDPQFLISDELLELLKGSYLEGTPDVLRAIISSPNLKKDKKKFSRLSLINLLYVNEPMVERTQLRNLLKDNEDDRMYLTTILKRLIVLDIALKDFKASGQDLEEAKQLERELNPPGVFKTDCLEVQSFFAAGDLAKARTHCYEMAARLPELSKFYHLDTIKQDPYQMDRGEYRLKSKTLQGSYYNVFDAAFFIGEYDLAVDTWQGVRDLEQKNQIPIDNNDYHLVDLVRRFKDGLIKDGNTQRKIKVLATEAGLL